MADLLIQQTVSTRALKMTSVRSCNDISYASSTKAPSPPSPRPSPPSPPPRPPSPRPPPSPPPSACSQATVEGSSPKALKQSFQSKPPMRGFYQWWWGTRYYSAGGNDGWIPSSHENQLWLRKGVLLWDCPHKVTMCNPVTLHRSNNGYCGETSLGQSALAYGTWISQYNIRSIATTYGSSVTQTGAANGATSQWDAQMLLDPPGTQGNSFEQAMINLKLVGKAFDPNYLQASGVKVRLMPIIVTFGPSHSLTDPLLCVVQHRGVIQGCILLFVISPSNFCMCTAI